MAQVPRHISSAPRTPITLLFADPLPVCETTVPNLRKSPFRWNTEDQDYVVVHAASRADIGCGAPTLQLFVDTPGGETSVPPCEQLLQVGHTFAFV